MKVLITGGAGYIGSHTIIEIIENTTWEVISIDDYSNSSVETYSRIEKITGKKVKHYRVDLKDLLAVEEVFNQNKDIKGIIHFAAYKAVGESVKKPLFYYDNNINSLKNILLCQAKYKVPNLIFSSSCAVYGNVNELPVTELTKPGKLESPYAQTKAIGEQMITDFLTQEKEVKVISLRYFNPIGEQDELLVFGNDYPTKDGTCVRDYVHVNDVAKAHVLALKHIVEATNSGLHDVINLGSGVGNSVLEIIETFERVNNIKINYKIVERRKGDIPAIYANSDKAQKVLGWKPKIALDEMIKSAWEWEKNLKAESE